MYETPPTGKASERRRESQVSEELLINVNDFETRVGLLQNGALAEIHLQRSGTYSLTGNIYQGRVQRILPGMQAAFVEIGLGRPGFLHARDIDPPRMDADGGLSEPADIRKLVHDGQSILVQVAKDPIANKGARLTTSLAVASRYLVLMPGNDHIGISQRIDEEDERERLRGLIHGLRDAQPLAQDFGFIARTAAEGIESSSLERDMGVLLRVWDRVTERARGAAVGEPVFQELPVHTRVLRDLASADLKAVSIDHLETYQGVRAFVEQFLPEFSERVVHFQGPGALFERYGIEEELERALQAKVALRCGGHLVIEQTEAMITIDVNTGSFVGGRNLEDTVFQANMEAASAIPRQLRLRNLGGIIVIDFIDMEVEAHQVEVLRVLEGALAMDPARTRVGGFSGLGLVELSRKRTRASLAQQMCDPCGHCAGRGAVLTHESVCYAIFRHVLDDAARRCRDPSEDQPTEYLVRAPQGVIDRLLDEASGSLAQLCKRVDREVHFQVEPSCPPGQFDVVLVPVARSGGRGGVL